MPDGEGVAEVFEPLEKGRELLARIMPVYQNTAEHNQEILDGGYIPGYFCPPAQDETEVRQTGERLLEGLREFARFVEDEELIAALAAIKQIFSVFLLVHLFSQSVDKIFQLPAANLSDDLKPARSPLSHMFTAMR